MVSHSIEQRHDIIRKPESVSIHFCSSWRSSQSPHVPFKLKQFQFFPLIAGSKVHSKERFFQGVEGKGLQVILSLFLSLPPCFCSHYLCVLLYLFKSVQFLCFALFNMFLFVFSFVYFVFHIKKKLKNQKNTKTVCVLCTLVLVYLGWSLKQNFLNFVSFVAQMSNSMHN